MIQPARKAHVSGEKLDELLDAIASVKRIEQNPKADFETRHYAHLILADMAKEYRSHLDMIAVIMSF